MRYHFLAVLSVATLVACGGPVATTVPVVNVTATQVRATEVAQIAALQATANHA